jgi:hypothetical protein
VTPVAFQGKSVLFSIIWDTEIFGIGPFIKKGKPANNAFQDKASQQGGYQNSGCQSNALKNNAMQSRNSSYDNTLQTNLLSSGFTISNGCNITSQPEQGKL